MTLAQIATRGSATFKPRDVEELIDFYVHRRTANLLVRLLAETTVTPNQVTILSGITAIVAGVLIGTATSVRPWQPVLGAAVFFSSIVLDCADGQLARLRKTSSFTGRALDGYTDVVSVVSIMVGQLGWLLATGCPLWLTQVVGWAAAFSFNWHVRIYDHMKNLYLYNTEPRGPGEVSSFPSLEDIERERLEHERAGRWFGALLCRGFRQYTEAQRRGLKDRTGLDRPGMHTAEERETYRRRFRLFMRLWSFNGVGTHLSLFVLATALTPLFPNAPLWSWAFVALPMNALTIGLNLAERGLETRLRAELETAKASA
jgi:hypothetical protein